MEMDCYSEYKHHVHPNHQHYGGNAAANHPYYPGNYGPASSLRYAHAHTSYSEGVQQQSYFDGYSRYNHGQLHHNHHHGNYSNSFNGHYGGMRENYHAVSGASGETGSGQYYYQNTHQTSASYYGNHSFDSYRNATTGYQYNHFGSAGYHQSALHPTQYYSSYNTSPTEQFNNRYYPTPPPSAPPTASLRDPYNLHSTDAQSYSSMESESSEKLNGDRLSIDRDKNSLNDPIASPTVKQSTEHAADGVEGEKKQLEVQTPESEKQTPHESDSPYESEKSNAENANEGVKVDVNLDSEEKEPKTTKHENQHQQSTSLFNENDDHNQHHHPCNESLTKANGANSQESTAATGSEVESSLATGKTKQTFSWCARELFDFHRAQEKEERKEKLFYLLGLPNGGLCVQLDCLHSTFSTVRNMQLKRF